MEMIGPCPFCGSEHLTIDTGSLMGGQKTYSVFCEECRVSSGVSLAENAAIAAWNTRTAYNPNERLREALEHARAAIASLDDDALGWSEPPHDEIEPWPLKAELLHMIDAALSHKEGGE